MSSPLSTVNYGLVGSAEVQGEGGGVYIPPPRPKQGLSKGDKTWIITVSPDGQRHWLAGTPKQGVQGVELARGLVGLDRPPTELLWLQEANQNGADLVGNAVDVRTLKGAVNILGNNPRDFRAKWDTWQRAWHFDRYSRMFFINSYGGVKYLDVLLGESPNGSIDMDPALLKREVNYPYTWVSPNPYYKGYDETFEENVTPPVTGQSVIDVKVRNLGTVPVFPKIYLPGPGVWFMPSGWRLPNHRDEVGRGALDGSEIQLPALKAGEGMWLDPDTRNPTITLVTATGVEKNLWAQMNSQRPRLKLFGGSEEKWTFRVQGGMSGAAQKIKIKITPLYSSFI